MAIEDSTTPATNSDAPGPTDRSFADSYTGVLEELSEATLAELELRVSEERLAPDTSIFNAGDFGDALYIIRSGLVDLRTGDDGDQHFKTLGPGDIFGEQALLTGRPRSAHAVAQTGVTLWRLDHTDFLFLIGSDPQLGATVARTLSERLTASNLLQMGSPRGQSVLLAAGPAPAAARLCADFAAQCGKLLGAAPLVLACGPAEVWEDAALPAGVLVVDPDDLAGAAVRAVRENILVVLLCAPDPPPDAFAGADRVVIVGDPPAGLNRIRGHPPRLVSDAPSSDDIGALAREVCGRRIGLALGSGGIRGWAHAGIIGVLTDESIPIDFVSGASAGALAGALFVAGMSADAMLQIPTIARDVLSACIRTYRPSFQAILSDRPFVQYLRDQLGKHTRIEDLPKPLIIATTDLDTREAVHLTTGPLPESIVASASVNGVFPPITLDGRRLVDGGASDPVPVAARQRHGRGPGRRRAVHTPLSHSDARAGGQPSHRPRHRHQPGLRPKLLHRRHRGHPAAVGCHLARPSACGQVRGSRGPGHAGRVAAHPSAAGRGARRRSQQVAPRAHPVLA
jgi:predicted acylesterase/phospholipase RssA/CRP-like cAMP-binding protein